MAHNTAFLVVIGGLVVNWANNESVFLAMLQALVGGGKHTAAIIWHSHRSTMARLELISRLARDQIQDDALTADIDGAIAAFKGASRTRNFFCHATYAHDSKLRLRSAQGVTLYQEGTPINFETKTMDAATMNEIRQASMGLAERNLDLWRLVPRIEAALGVRRVRLPPQLAEALQNQETHHPRSEAPKPE
jgi:hypothetical protein